MANLTNSQWAAIRQLLSALAGMAVLTGAISVTGAQDMVNKIVDLGAAIGAVVTAGGAILVTINSLIANYKASPDQQKIAVAAQPNTMVVTTTAASSDAQVAAKVATLSEVTEVLSTDKVAANTVSDKVVSMPTPTIT